MSHAAITPEARYEALVETLVRDSDVMIGLPGKKGFGASALCVNGKIFAMLTRGRLVVKLPSAQVDALIATGVGERFDPRNNGRLMKEWLVVAPASEEDWQALARDALTFVAKKG